MTFIKRLTLLVPGAFLCTVAAFAQSPATVTQLDGTPGPTYAPPPAPGGLDYWNRINGTGAAGALPFSATKPYNNFSVNTFKAATGAQTFQGGGSKDPNDTSQWAWSGSPTPSKDTLTNAYAAAYTGAIAGGHTILNFGTDRFSTSGDANIGAWFFQQNIGPVAGGSFGPGKHSNGDIFLISAFTNGGGTSTITVYLWDSASSGPVLPNGPANGCPNSNYPTPTTLPACAATNLLEVYSASANSVCGANPTCAVTNGANIDVEWPYAAKSNSGTGTSTIPQGAFFTGGVDLTFIFNLVGLNVPCLSSFLMDTRSSQSPSAVLKDFIGGGFQLCAIGASASCTTPATYTVGPPASIHYQVDGTITNQASGALYGVTVNATAPTGASNVVITQPVSPINGGASAPFNVKFDFPTEGAVTISGSVCGAASSGGACTVTTDANNAPANWSATVGNAGCSISTNPTMTLTKSCVVTLVPGSGGVVLQLKDTIKVCNTDTKDTISNINLSNNVDHGPSADTIVSGLTLVAGQCQSYTPVYTPTGCVGGVIDPAGGGRCLFQDTVSVSSTPKDEFGNPLPQGAIPGAQTANCAVCPSGACLP